jgi:hypothetical protein
MGIDNQERTIFSMFQFSYDYANVGFKELMIAMIPTNKILDDIHVTEKAKHLVQKRKKYCLIFQIIFFFGIIL